MKSTIVFTLLAVFLVIEAKSAFSNNGKDLVIKSQALIKSYVGNQFSRYCGGVAIHPRFVLTDYTCVRDITSHEVVIGIREVTESSKWYKNDCASIGGDMVYMVNLGVLIFIQPINGGDITIANLPVEGSDVLANDPVYVSGYGTYNLDKIAPSLNLTIAQFTGFSRDICSTKYRPLVDDTTFCYYTGADQCQVDLGSPVYSDENTVAGLTLYRDTEECSDSRPVVSSRFGSIVMLNTIVMITSNDSWTTNCTDSDQLYNTKQKLLRLRN